MKTKMENGLAPWQM